MLFKATVSCDNLFGRWLRLRLRRRTLKYQKNVEYTGWRKRYLTDFDVLLTVHLSIILVINQLNAQNLVL